MSHPTREKIIEAAYELFYHSGFHGTGLDQILHKTGYTKSTFYNHFGSKDELILAVLRWRDAGWPNHLLKTLHKHGGDRPRDQLLALFDVLAEVWGTTGYHGCLFIRAAAEFPLPHDPIHVVVHDHAVAVATALRELAGYAGARDPENLSRKLLVLAAGAFAIKQMGDPQKAAESAKALARQTLEDHLGRSKEKPKPNRPRGRISP